MSKSKKDKIKELDKKIKELEEKYEIEKRHQRIKYLESKLMKQQLSTSCFSYIYWR